MKRLFGFIAGAGLGAGLVYGVRRLLGGAADQSAGAENFQTGVHLTGRPPAQEASPTVGEAAESQGKTATETSGVASEAKSEVLEAEKEKDQEQETENPANRKAAGPLDEASSLAGEPPARHVEPLAATNTDARASSPRSETTEIAVPSGSEVQAPQPQSAKSSGGSNGSANGSRKKRENQSAERDNFTPIFGVGDAYNKRLHEAGIHTFAALSELSPEEIEEKSGIPADLIRKDDWCNQAGKLARNKKSH